MCDRKEIQKKRTMPNKKHSKQEVSEIITVEKKSKRLEH